MLFEKNIYISSKQRTISILFFINKVEFDESHTQNGRPCRLHDG